LDDKEVANVDDEKGAIVEEGKVVVVDDEELVDSTQVCSFLVHYRVGKAQEKNKTSGREKIFITRPTC